MLDMRELWFYLAFISVEAYDWLIRHSPSVWASSTFESLGHKPFFHSLTI